MYLLPGTAKLSKRSDTKQHFAAIPARAMTDKRLSAQDFRALMAIAYHDRFSKNGAGCYASHTTLAKLVACHIKALSRSLAALAEYGYIEGRLNPLNKKTRIYYVIYSDDDAHLEASKSKGNNSATENAQLGNSHTTDNATIGSKSVSDRPSIGNRGFENIELDQHDAEGKISCEARNISRENDIRNSPEGASPSKNRKISDGEMLARIERQMKSGQLSNDTLRMFSTAVEGIAERAEVNSTVYGQSERLLNDIYDLLPREPSTELPF